MYGASCVLISNRIQQFANTPHRYRNSRAIMGFTQCYLPPGSGETIYAFPPLPEPIKAGTRFSDPGGMQGWVDLVGLVTYRGGISTRRRSPILVLTRLDVEQLRSCDERRCHCAKPPAINNDRQVLIVGAKSAVHDYLNSFLPRDAYNDWMDGAGCRPISLSFQDLTRDRQTDATTVS